MSTTQTHKEALTLARQLLWRYRHETPVGKQPYMICQEVDEAFERIDEALMSFQDGAQPAVTESHKQKPLAYIRKDQLQQAAQSPMLCEVTPEPRQDRIGIYTAQPTQCNCSQRQCNINPLTEAAHNIKENT